MTDREAMERALDALELVTDLTNHDDDVYAAIDALRERLAQPEQDPMAKVELMTTGGNAGLATRIVEIEDHLRERLRPGQLLYTAPQRREWVGLTDDEVDEWTPEIHSVIRSIEAKLKEKNT